MNALDAISCNANGHDLSDSDMDHLVGSAHREVGFPCGAPNHVHWTVNMVAQDRARAFPSIRRLASSYCYIGEGLNSGWLEGGRDYEYDCRMESRIDYANADCRPTVLVVMFVSHAKPFAHRGRACLTRKTANENGNESAYGYDCVASQPQVARTSRP